MIGAFVTGTDTGVGKTLCAVALVQALARDGLRVAAMKPVASGAWPDPRADGALRNDDALALHAAANVPATYDELNPFCFSEPVSPHIAAQSASVAVDFETIFHRYGSLCARADAIVVEGAGGVLVPLGPQLTVLDLAVRLELPIVLVVGLRLGCINHALLSAAAIQARGARLAGWIANHLDSQFARLEENLATLQAGLGSAPLAFVPHGADAAHAAACLPPNLALRLTF